MNVFGELRVLNFVVFSIQVVGLKHIDYFQHENGTCLSVDSLAFDLVALVVCQELLFGLQFDPHLVEDVVRHEQVVYTQLELEQLLTV